MIYVGQAIGSGVGGFLLAHGRPLAVGYVGVAFVVGALILLVFTRGRDETFWRRVS